MTTGAELFERHASNPILTADQWPVAINSVFNAGACRVGDETVLVCRVEDLRGLSHLWVARSDDGITNWRIDDVALLSPNASREGEMWGFEDPRIVYLDERGCYAITCTAYGPIGPSVYLCTTDDFRTLHATRGSIMSPDDKNASLLPRRVGGQWVLFHRPLVPHAGNLGNIFVSRSDDLVSWRGPELTMRARPGAWWDSLRIGVGPPPIEVDDGWLLIYHGVRESVSGATYRLGVAMLDRDDPSIVIRRADEWVLAPREPYERIGDVANVVFSCGAICDVEQDRLDLYYGCADSAIAMASTSLRELCAFVMSTPIPEI